MNVVVFLMQKKGHHCLCYLDDFVGVALSFAEGRAAYDDMLQLADQLELDLVHNKCIPPMKNLEWLGFDISVSCGTEHGSQHSA